MNLETSSLMKEATTTTTKKPHHLLYDMSRISKSIGRKWMGDFQGVGRRVVTANVYRVSSQSDENILELNNKGNCTTLIC